MVDIHYHLLFNVDDGPSSIEASLELAEASIAEGVTHIVCTPHANDRYPFNPTVNRQELAELVERLGDRITLGLGCDFHLTYENIADLNEHRSKYTINGSQYLLIEFPDFGVSTQTLNLLYEMRVDGIIPIVTHPERNPTLVRNLELLKECVRFGCLIQITAGSLIGGFGRTAQHISNELIKRQWVHVISSDAHTIEGRPPAMKPAYSYLKDHFGQDEADRLCTRNPRSIFMGEALLPGPGPIGVYEDAERVKKGFLRRIFRR